MSLNDVKLNTECIVKRIDIDDEKTKIRLMELGLIEGARVLLKHKSLKKKTLLLVLNSCCFTIKDSIASGIMVKYA